MERTSTGINSSEEIKGNLDRPVVREKNCPKGCGDMSQKKVRFDQFELDYGRFQLSRDGAAVRLEGLPLQLLMLLIDNQPTVVTRRADCGAVVGQGFLR